MPKLLDQCVIKLISNPKFYPRQEGQSKEEAAYAVCNYTLKKSGELSYVASAHEGFLQAVEESVTKNELRFETPDSKPLALSGEGKPPKEFELFVAGTYFHPWYGELKFTEKMFDDFVISFEARIEAKGRNKEDNVLPINEGHNKGGKAFGWIGGLERREDALWATEVEWTELGIEALQKKFYKYVSAEWWFEYEDLKTGQKSSNVLTGAGLTNIPYMQILTPLTFSMESAQNSNDKEKPMKLSEILAKDPSELSTEEIAFLKANSADLDDSQKEKFASVLEASTESTEEADDKETDNENADQNQDQGEGNQASMQNGEIKLSQAEYDALKAQANKAAELEMAAKEREQQEFVASFIHGESNQTGKFTPASRESLSKLVASLDEAGRKLFKEFAETIKSPEVFSENGGQDDNRLSAAQKLDTLAKEKVAEARKNGKKMSYSDALSELKKEMPELAEDYTATLGL